jgi:cytoskeleton protein RodZ
MARKPRQTSAKKTKTVAANETVASVEADLEKEVVVEDASTEAPVSSDNNLSRCGGALRKMREAQSLSINDVASQLRLSGKQVASLEADDFASLPEAMIVKGFIRNYAKLLRMPAEPLLDAYGVIVPDEKRHSLTLQSSVDMVISEPKRMSLKHYFRLILIGILAVGIWFFYQNYIQKPNPVVAGEVLSERFVDTLPQVVLPAIERSVGEVTATQLELNVTESNINAESSEVAVIPSVAGQDDMASTVVTEKPVEEEAEVVDGANTVATLALDDALDIQKPLASGKSRLEFNVTQETWVSIINASDSEVYNKILFAGNREVIDVWPPVKLVVGNAHGATLRVNGDVVDLAPYTRINVARIPID